MSMTLLSQLDTYYSKVEQEQRPISPDEVAARLDTQPRELTPRIYSKLRQGWLIGLAAAAAVLVFGAVAAVLWTIESEPPAIDPGSSLTWSRVPHDDAAFSGRSEVWNDDVIVLELSMSDVAVGGPGLVAVGMEEWPDVGTPSAIAPSDVAVWTSVDGTAWTRLPHNEAEFGRADVGGLIAGGPGLIAVGSRKVVPGVVNDAVVWTSPDGITWSQVPHDEAVFGSAKMNSVTPFGSGYVAVGGTGTGQIRSGNAVAWTSPDGVTWTRAPHIEKTTAGSTGQEGMSQVAAGSAGSLVAVGWEWSERNEPFSPPVWRSRDGITWSRVSDDEAVFEGAAILSVVSGGPGFIAFGSVGADAAVWTSPDGITWSRVPHDDAVFGEAGISDVARGGPGFIAVGWAGLDAAAWTSPDGITWSRVPHDETIFGGQPENGISSVVAFGSEIVAVGASGEPEGRRDAAVWIARVED